MCDEIEKQIEEQIVDQIVEQTNPDDTYIYFVAECANFCPRAMLINTKTITPNLQEALDVLFNSSIEIKPNYYTYTKMPMIQTSKYIWKQQPNLCQCDKIANILSMYSEYHPGRCNFEGALITDKNCGIDPVYTNGWYDSAILDILRSRIDISKYKIVKTIYIIEPELPNSSEWNELQDSPKSSVYSVPELTDEELRGWGMTPRNKA